MQNVRGAIKILLKKVYLHRVSYTTYTSAKHVRRHVSHIEHETRVNDIQLMVFKWITIIRQYTLYQRGIIPRTMKTFS